jgi:hypothetical protein
MQPLKKLILCALPIMCGAMATPAQTPPSLPTAIPPAYGTGPLAPGGYAKFDFTNPQIALANGDLYHYGYKFSVTTGNCGQQDRFVQFETVGTVPSGLTPGFTYGRNDSAKTGSVTISVTTESGPFNGSVSGNVLTVIDPPSFPLIIGDLITGDGVAANSYVIAQKSGTIGGGGDYTLNMPSSSATNIEPMTASMNTATSIATALAVAANASDTFLPLISGTCPDGLPWIESTVQPPPPTYPGGAVLDGSGVGGAIKFGWNDPWPAMQATNTFTGCTPTVSRCDGVTGTFGTDRNAVIVSIPNADRGESNGGGGGISAAWVSYVAGRLGVAGDMIMLEAKEGQDEAGNLQVDYEQLSVATASAGDWSTKLMRVNGPQGCGWQFAGDTIVGKYLTIQPVLGCGMILQPNAGFPLVLGQTGPVIVSTELTLYNGFRSLPRTMAELVAHVNCNAGSEGYESAITDGSVALFNAILTGGGSNHVKAYCNGTNWTVH